MHSKISTAKDNWYNKKQPTTHSENSVTVQQHRPTRERSATNQPQHNNHKNSTRETRQKNRTHQHQNTSKYQDTFGKNIYIPKHSTIILTSTFLPAGNRPPQHRTTHQEKNASATRDPQRRRTNQQHKKNPNEYIRQKPLTYRSLLAMRAMHV